MQQNIPCYFDDLYYEADIIFYNLQTIINMPTNVFLHTIPNYIIFNWDFPGACSSKRPKRCGFNHWVGKIPWRSTWKSIHFSILAWRTPWTEGPGRLQSIELRRDMTEATQHANIHYHSPTTDKYLLWHIILKINVKNLKLYLELAFLKKKPKKKFLTFLP